MSRGMKPALLIYHALQKLLSNIKLSNMELPTSGNCSQNVHSSKLLLHILVAQPVTMIVFADDAAGRKEFPIPGMTKSISILF